MTVLMYFKPECEHVEMISFEVVEMLGTLT